MELYKKYRPTSFEGMIGCTETANALIAMVERKTVPHFILFEGPSGLGKTTMARILATELGCADFDCKEMNSANYRGIDSIRELQQGMHLHPAMGKCRVFILEEGHAFTSDAQEAMLKMLEDTPSHVYFFLTTTDPIRLKNAILTRACRMPVRLLTEPELESLCDRVAKAEKLTISRDVRDALVTGAAGSARTLLVLLDKVANLPENEREASIESIKAEESEAIDLCRALIKKQSWPVVAKILQSLTGDPENTRRAVLRYARAVLLKEGDYRSYYIISCFSRNFWDTGTAGIAYAAYEAIHGD